MKRVINNIRSNIAMLMLQGALHVFPQQERVIVAKGLLENMDALKSVEY